MDETKVSLQYDMQFISYWMQENRLSLNAIKTEFLMVGPKQRLSRIPPISISLNGQMIDTVNRFKYLGLILDNHLQFHDHIEYIVDKVFTKLGLLYKTRWLFDQSTALMLFKSLISLHFDFGSVVYKVSPLYQLHQL